MREKEIQKTLKNKKQRVRLWGKHKYVSNFIKCKWTKHSN